ncbi:proline racemase [Leucosporidium creatinivorum]|uniref:trans-L-3-hydroxyproline dehydratase n=1 Tax=Leucosporidium creatinivorum TaxID=106004 RepID=A0A1Y2FKZ1_9BASI|nr:proline racemase [Leucosporidium creatinivorum]
MDVFNRFVSSTQSIVAIDMHTVGEPSRIVCRGVDHLLNGSRLLDKRDDAKLNQDHLRKRIMFEPRGHPEMYGAILVRETELTRSGEAHIGVLFTHNEGYSTMCGHATMALGRFLVDTLDTDVFPVRSSLKHDPETSTTQVNLHAPCGLVRISVPTLLKAEQITYDSSRLVSFLSVPSFATAIDVEVEVPASYRWPELGSRTSIVLSVSYGGAFYAILPAEELGFGQGLRNASMEALSHATAQLKALIMKEHAYTTHHPTEPSLSYLYGVVVSDSSFADELGLCFFADQQVDRSPTGSAVGARIALAHAKGQLSLNTPKRYHSIVSIASKDPSQDGFVGEAVEVVDIEGGEGVAAKGVVIKTSGEAFYTGASAFVHEPQDRLSHAGFKVELPRA